MPTLHIKSKVQSFGAKTVVKDDTSLPSVTANPPDLAYGTFCSAQEPYSIVLEQGMHGKYAQSACLFVNAYNRIEVNR